MQAFIADFIPEAGVDFSEELFMKVVFSGCDFRCPYCNHPGLLETKFEHEFDLRELKREMSNYCGKIKGLFVTGGEPCFQRSALIELLKNAKDLKLKTAVDTNGSKPAIIEYLLKNNLVNTLIVDLKAPFNELFEKVTRSATFFKSSKDVISDFRETLQVLKAYDETVEIIFRTTIIPNLIFRKEDVSLIGKEIEGVSAVWELKAFSPSIVYDKSLEGVNSPTIKFLENLASYLQKQSMTLNVRVLD